MINSQQSKIDRLRQWILVIFGCVLALGLWNPFVPYNPDVDQNSGISITQIYTIFFVLVLFVLQYLKRTPCVKYPLRGCVLGFFVCLLLTTLLHSLELISISALLFFVKLGLGIMLVYLIPKNYGNDRGVIHKALLAFSVSSAVIATLSMAGFLGNVLTNHDGRFWLFGENPNSTGGRLALAIFYIIYFISDNPLCWKAKRFYLLVVVMPLFILLMAGGSRGGLIILVVVVFFYLLFRPTKNFFKKAILLIAISFFGIVLFNYTLQNNEDFAVAERLLSMQEDNDDSGRSRLNDQTMEIFYANPILGVGAIEYRTEMMAQFGETRVSHNMFIYILAEAGMVGFSLFCLFLFGIAQRCYKCLKKDALPACLYLFMLLLTSKTGGVLTYLLLWFVWAIVICFTHKNSINKI